MKLIKSIIILVLLICWTLQTNAQEKINSIILLKEHQPAPYEGILMKVDDLRFLEKDADLKDLYEQKLYECTLHKYPEIPYDESKAESDILKVVAGMILGGVIVSIIRH